MIAWNAIAAGAAVFGAFSNKRSQDKAASNQNEYTQRQYEYDTEMWEMGKEKLKANYDFAYETYELQKRNDQKSVDFINEKNLRRYNYDLKIVKAQNEANKLAFAKSENIYNQQLNFNNMAAADAAEEAVIKQREINQEIAFNNEDAIIKSIEAKGQLAVTAQSGGSALKAYQNIIASKGRNEARLAESLFSSQRNTAMSLRTISRDKYGADLAAFANKMLEPGLIPDPVKPVDAPLTEWQPPRALIPEDFGVAPIKGAKAQGGSWLATASSAIGSVAKIGAEENWFN
tara:strand:+ start:45 stop:908 length:864 start_codon:yes stop_codon:yes gene_type:complete